MASQSIQEYLDVPKTWPVRENIKHEIVLMPSKVDIRKAEKGEPMACALHNAACRVFDIPNCAIGGRVALIPQRDAKGKHYIARMRATAETQKAIAKFDKTGAIPEGGFRFVPLGKAETLKAKRTYMKKYYAGDVGHNTKPKPGAGIRKHRRKVSTRMIPTNVKAS